MFEKIKDIFKKFFYLSPQETNGIFIMILILLTIFVLKKGYNSIRIKLAKRVEINYEEIKTQKI